jgi:ADP-heptose:LPS heptosyltransferase
MRFHVLMIRFSSLGDVVLQTSVVQWLKSTYGDRLRVSFVTSKEFASLVEGHPHIHRVLKFDRRGGNLSGLVGEIKRLHEEDPIHLLLDLHATTRSWLLRWKLWWLPRLVVNKHRLSRFVLLRLPWAWPKKFWSTRPHVERVARDWQGVLLAPFQENVFPRTFSPATPQPQHPRRYVVFSPVASFAPKRWPLESFVKLARLVLAHPRFEDHDIIVLGGPNDDYCRAFDEVADARLINLQGQTSLAESAGWVQHAQLVVGNDSGMNHLAETHGVPVVTIFGPTHEAFGFAAHGPRSQNLSVELWCRPCSPTGKRPCFRSEQVCFTSITPERVLQAMVHAW